MEIKQEPTDANNEELTETYCGHAVFITEEDPVVRYIFSEKDESHIFILLCLLYSQ